MRVVAFIILPNWLLPAREKEDEHCIKVSHVHSAITCHNVIVCVTEFSCCLHLEMKIATGCPMFKYCTRTRNYVDEQALLKVILITTLQLNVYIDIAYLKTNYFLSSFVSPVSEMRAEVGSFPGIILHPPLPSLMHPQDPSAKPHQQSSQTGTGHSSN